MSTPFILRRFQPSDYPGVRAVMEASYGPEATPHETFAWWHLNCPVSSSGFMVVEADGRVAGLQPMEIFDFDLAGRSMKGAVLTGVVVHPDYRRRGLFTALIKACEQEAWRQGADFITTMPNDRSRPGFLKLGYVDPGRRRLLLAVLNETRLAERAVGMRWLARIGGLCFRPFFRSGRWRRVPAAPGVRELRAVPEDVEGLEDANRTCFPGLRTRRSHAWLSWRYGQSPLRKYRLFAQRGDAGELRGLLVTTQEERQGWTVCYLVDWLVSEVETLRILVLTALNAAQADGCTLAASVVSSPVQARALARCGLARVPLWAPLKRFYTVFRPGPRMDPESVRKLSAIAAWHQTLGDWDNL